MSNCDLKFRDEFMWHGYVQIAGRADECLEVDSAPESERQAKSDDFSEGWDA